MPPRAGRRHAASAALGGPQHLFRDAIWRIAGQARATAMTWHPFRVPLPCQIAERRAEPLTATLACRSKAIPACSSSWHRQLSCTESSMPGRFGQVPGHAQPGPLRAPRPTHRYDATTSTKRDDNEIRRRTPTGSGPGSGVPARTPRPARPPPLSAQRLPRNCSAPSGMKMACAPCPTERRSRFNPAPAPMVAHPAASTTQGSLNDTGHQVAQPFPTVIAGSNSPRARHDAGPADRPP